MCADFCSDIKSLRSFLRAAYDKKSVRVRWLQSDKKSEWRLSNNETSPAIVTHNSSDKKSVRFFLGAACDKKSVVCADSVREKIGPSLRLFLGAPYDKKSVRVRWALAMLLNEWITWDVQLMTSLSNDVAFLTAHSRWRTISLKTLYSSIIQVFWYLKHFK